MKRVDKVEEGSRVFFFDWEQHDIVYCNDIRMHDSAICLHGCCRYLLGPQTGYKFLHSEEIPLFAALDSVIYEVRGNVCLASAGWYLMHYVVGLVHPGQLTEFVQLPLRYSRDEVEVVLVKVMFWRYSGSLDTNLTSMKFPHLSFHFQDIRKEVNVSGLAFLSLEYYTVQFYWYI